MEAHLLDAFDVRTATGGDAREAFEAACWQMGHGSLLESEFRKARTAGGVGRHPFLHRSFWNVAMLANYLKVALRNLRRHRAYTLINVAGLAVTLPIEAVAGTGVPVVTMTYLGGAWAHLWTTRQGLAGQDDLTGGFSLTRGNTVNATLTSSAIEEVAVMTVALADVRAFVGLDGPYWLDSNGDGVLSRSELDRAFGSRGASRVLSRQEARSYGAGGVNVTIVARDAESFRQSRTQVAADIARAVSLGRRGL